MGDYSTRGEHLEPYHHRTMATRKARAGQLARASAPLAGAAERFQILERAGLSGRRRAELAAKSVAELESLLTNPEVDAFARIAAAKTLLRDVCGIQPSKLTAQVSGSQAPVIINIGDAPPAPSSRPRVVSVDGQVVGETAQSSGPGA